MKRVLMLATMAGPDAVRHGDMPYWLDDDEADELVAAGYARLLSKAEPETAMLGGAETTALPEAKPRGRSTATKRGRKKAE